MHLRAFLLVFVPIAFVLVVTGVLGYWWEQHEKEASHKTILLSDFIGKTTPKNLISPPPLRDVGEPPAFEKSLLTGLPRISGEVEKIVGVMIDEAPGARAHHTGIEKARMVFEAPAEGGIPRLLTLFSSEDFPEKIGPVRSARHYFVQMAEPIAGAYVHAGGSPQGLEEVYNSSLINIDEGFNDKHFERDNTIARPHNLFLLPETISEEIPPSSHEEALFLFSEDIPTGLSSEDAPFLDVDFSTTQHHVSWQYDAEKKCYQRKQSMETSDICATNVGILIIPIWSIEGDKKGRLDMNTIGSGFATIFRDGKAISGKWNRNKDEVFSFTTESGEEIPLKPGTTFFQIVGSKEKFSFSSPG
ncbi:DUF3048 domain-containing protein [Candidatus Peregrinibacteria bacterium]|nr:MAG: DUF3048 domain-containing protein [Candidatus Peregrinibacteria bacterium]